MLKGHGFDLDALTGLFPNGDPRVIQTDEGTFLEATALDEPFKVNDGGRLVEVADSILTRLNGAAMLHNAGYRPVILAGHFRRGSHRHIMVHDEVRLQDSITVHPAEARIAGLATMTIGGVAAAQAPEGPL